MATVSATYKMLECNDAESTAQQLTRELSYARDLDALKYKTSAGDFKYFYPGAQFNLSDNTIPVYNSTSQALEDSTIENNDTKVTIDNNLEVQGSTISAPNISAGEDNSVLVLQADGTIRTDEIDPRVWGTSLADVFGTPETGNYARFTAAHNTIEGRTAAQVVLDIGAQAALTNPVTGTGTAGYIPKFSNTSSLVNSVIRDNGSQIAMGAPPYEDGWRFVRMANSTDAAVVVETFSSTGSAESSLNFCKSHNNTIDNFTETNINEYLGSFSFWGVKPESTYFSPAARIAVVQTGSGTQDGIPAAIVFMTSNDTDDIERMRIATDGKIFINSLKVSQTHPDHYQQVYVNTDTGELYRIAY